MSNINLIKADERRNSMIHNIPVRNISPNPNQPRKDFDERALYGLMQSIKDYGVIQPLSVRITSPMQNNLFPSYELIAGERRLRAVKLLSWETVPCVIVNADGQISAEIAIIENLQREDLNFFEQAMAIKNLIELFGYTQEQAARRLSVSQSYIANKIRILKLSDYEIELIINNKLTERHARSFIRINDEKERRQIIETVIKRSMNVSSTDKYIDKILNGNPAENIPETPGPRRSFIVKDVRLFLNTIDKVVDTIAQSGIDVKSEKTDKGEYIEIYLNVPKKKT
ncbi:MAG: ParB/RepB/Spo0J family partition protein [Oscillospiraceae bacterium]|nr:ParB/RepB/Spo0J family partition protein [Oscillospiraceae bacterium]